MTHGFNLTELLRTNETLVKELAEVKVQLRLCVEALKRYEPIAAYDRKADAFNDFVARKCLEKLDKRWK